MHRDLGPRSEALAAAYLEAHDYEIVARNYRINRKEIDIIARRADTVAFVEVKARAGPGYGHGLEAITWKKRRVDRPLRHAGAALPLRRNRHHLARKQSHT